MRRMQTRSEFCRAAAGTSLSGQFARAAANRRPSGPAPCTAWRDAPTEARVRVSRTHTGGGGNDGENHIP
jgi:hypothetical protein